MLREGDERRMNLRSCRPDKSGSIEWKSCCRNDKTITINLFIFVLYLSSLLFIVHGGIFTLKVIAGRILAADYIDIMITTKITIRAKISTKEENHEKLMYNKTKNKEVT